jgi:curved DNA-binding protein CbpA
MSEEQQEQSCKDILKCKDYYDILGLTKSATIDEIKKAYRKKSIKVHPDKNHNPKAEEAFKKLS